MKIMPRIYDVDKLHAGLPDGISARSVHFNSGGTFFVRMRGETVGKDTVVIAGMTYQWPVVQISAAGGASAINAGEAFIQA